LNKTQGSIGIKLIKDFLFVLHCGIGGLFSLFP
jgi:hypothetical protein